MAFLPGILIVFFCCAARGQDVFPSVTRYESAIYPAAARAVGAGGSVLVAIEVNQRGEVISAVAQNGFPLLRKASELAAEKWTFSRLEGNHFLTIRFLFNLPSRKEKEGFRIIGVYSLQITPRYQEILNTVDQKSNAAK